MTRLDDALALFGRADIALIDQFQRGRFRAPGRVLDAGCGSGRNLDPFVHGGHEVWLLDPDPAAVDAARDHCARLDQVVPTERTRVAPVEACDLRAAAFDVVLSIAVLHFARDPAHWSAQVDALWRLVAPGGVLFARLASSIGTDGRFEPLGNGRFRLGDGSTRYLVTLDDLLAATDSRGGTLLDPVKTVDVQGLRSMTTWVLRR